MIIISNYRFASRILSISSSNTKCYNSAWQYEIRPSVTPLNAVICLFDKIIFMSINLYSTNIVTDIR